VPRRNLPTRRRRTVNTEQTSPAGVSPSGSVERVVPWRGEDWVVRSVPGASAAGKAYRCPGCDQLVPGGTAHVVAWPVADRAAEHRRHWHSACWAARDRRAPGVQRSRSAPRY
jgi:hypothetical protein